MNDYKNGIKAHIRVSRGLRAKRLHAEICHILPTFPIEEANVIVAIGGDGFLLHSLHYLNYIKSELPVFGINGGTIGFLLNHLKSTENIEEIIIGSIPTPLFALMASVTDHKNDTNTIMAFNEISLLRSSAQTCKIQLNVNGYTSLESFSGDGLIVATPLGSSAYNYSAGGMILPMGCKLMAVTPVCGFRPRGWRGAILPDNYLIELINLDPTSRPLKLTADQNLCPKIVRVLIKRSIDPQATLLFDANLPLQQKIINEQFA